MIPPPRSNTARTSCSPYSITMEDAELSRSSITTTKFLALIRLGSSTAPRSTSPLERILKRPS
ncbi:glucose-methanol-choline (GMC) oxidoreductase family protein [Musa troglodytarum]|uniref:Glucose-methanol-choline (GMC) oxidoreductase family protein n=1 Tax=Musa troglodytarum TaxID=320322 RepID=A0A9E7FY50_9LILI|nr:glucose-methanol-choline (GMC) oxidoreductase family protein [Musa troglodytarum]